MAPEFKIKAYLSYKFKDVAETEIKLLEEACCGDGRSIELAYSGKELQRGDNFVEFMRNDLAGARFLIVFCSPEYFRTGYTLYEFISAISADSYGVKIYVAPVRVTTRMSLKDKTVIRETILYDKSDTVRKEIELVTRLWGKEWLSLQEEEVRENIWALVEQGWEKSVAPVLETVLPALDAVCSDENRLAEIYGKIAQDICEVYEKLLGEKKVKIENIIRKNITNILQEAVTAFKTQFKKNLGVANSKDDVVADSIFQGKRDVRMLLIFLLQTLEDLRDRCGEAMFAETISNAKQIAGWLVLMSLNNHWLVHNEHKMLMGGRAKFPVNLTEDELAYAEVIISSKALRRARFRMDREKGLLPDRRKIRLCVFEASQNALRDEVIIPIWEDLKIIGSPPNEEEKLLDKIVAKIDLIYEVQKKKPIYYLVDSVTFNLIIEQPWFEKYCHKVRGKFVLFIIDTVDKSCGDECCCEKIDSLLTAVAEIYNYSN